MTGPTTWEVEAVTKVTDGDTVRVIRSRSMIERGWPPYQGKP